MAARDKKTPAGSGGLSGKKTNASSPVPLRESTNNVQTAPIAAGTISSPSTQTQSHAEIVNEAADNQNTQSDLDTADSNKKTESTTLKRGSKKEDDANDATETNANASPVRRTTPKRGKKVVAKRNTTIKNKLKTELKAKNKTVKRKPTKKIAAAAELELANSPEKKTTLLKNGIRNTKLRKTVNENKATETENPETVTVTKGRKRKIGAKKSPTQDTPSDVPQTKKEVEDDAESEKKSETPPVTTPKKVRRVLKRNILGPTKRTLNKKLSAEKQKIVDAIAKVTNFDKEARDVINQLDLNVAATNLKKTVELNKKRRHSIEKTALFNDDEHLTALPRGFINFMTVPRSGSPKTRKGTAAAKTGRQSSDMLMSHMRTRSPYSTRSDSPARILRNGKHRKLKDTQLLDGIESEYRKRRRILSDSREGSEISKNSGYLSESESSYCESTVSAIENGTPDIQLDLEPLKNVDEVKVEPIKKDIVDPIQATVSPERNKEIEASSTIDNLKDEVQIDNENNNKNKSIKMDVPKDTALIDDKSKIPQILEEFEQVNSNVPEKIIILSKMAQNFNDVPVDSETTWAGKRTRTTNKKTGKQTTEEPPVVKSVPEDILNKPKPEETVTKPAGKLDENIPAKKFYGEGAVAATEETAETNEKTAVASSTPEKLPMADTDSNILFSDNTILDSSDIVNNLECNNSSELANTSNIKLKLEESTATENEDNVTPPVQKPEDSTVVDKPAEDDITKPDIPPEETIQTIQEVAKSPEPDTIPSLPVEEPKETTETSTESVIVKDDSVLKPLDINTVDVVTTIKQPTPITSEQPEDENKDVSSVENINAPTNMIIETPENQKIKEMIMKALGLQSSKEAAETKVTKAKRPITRTDPYTGTLKTVIKLNRTSPEKKKGRGHLKMTLQKSKSKNGNYTNGESMDGMESSPDVESNTYYKVMKEVNTGWNTGAQSSDTAGANRKSHYSSNRSNTDGSSEQMSDDGGGPTAGADGEDGAAGGNSAGKEKMLVIPEKASSFSIHPQRLCRDECCYCFGRFGLFDTPCHIAQMKSTERQRKILEIEKHLTPDSCLCDACYRHVDRKANVPSYSKQYKRTASTGPQHSGPRICHAAGCQQDATHSVRRKWILKMKRNLHQYVQFDLDSTQGLHSIPVCETHFETLERLMTCAMCKRRLARNQAHNIDFSEAEQLNEAFENHKLPIRLATANAGTSTDTKDTSSGGSAVCKLCRYFATLLLKPPDVARPPHTLLFFESYEKRLMQFSDAEMMDENDIEDSIPVPVKEKEKEKASMKKNKKGKFSKTLHNKQNSANCVEQTQSENAENFVTQKHSPAEMQSDVVDQIKTDVSSPPTSTPNDSELNSNDNSVTKDPRVPSNNNIPDADVSLKSRSNSPLNNVFNSNSVEPSDADVIINDSETRSNKTEVPNRAVLVRRLAKDSKHIVELHKIQKDKKPSTASINHKVVERLETNPSISVRQLFPGEDDLPLQGSVEFGNVKERTPEGWEKCNMTIQYDHDTKRLWSELQKPYGNHSSFLRHLILLEKYFRNGDLVLTPSASHHATNYCESVQNRLRAYDNIPSNSSNIQPIAMLPFNTPGATVRKQTISQSGIITGTTGPKPIAPKTSTPITLGTMPPSFISPVNIVRQRSPSVPPGLIQLQSSGPRPQSTLLRLPPGNRRPFPQSLQANRIQKQMRPTLVPLTPNKIAATITSGALTKPTDGKRAPSVVQVMSGGKSFQLSFQDYSRMYLMKQREGIDLRPIGPKKMGNGNSGAQTVSFNTVSVLRQRSPVTSAVTTTPREPTQIDVSNKNILDQFKQQSLSANTTSATATEQSSTNSSEQTVDKKPQMILPKIPKSLTVIPQTVRKSCESQSPPNLSVVTLNKPS